jgi:hypothetical protein
MTTGLPFLGENNINFSRLPQSGQSANANFALKYLIVKLILTQNLAIPLTLCLKTSYGLDPANGIDMTTGSESAGLQIQNNRNLIIKITQTYKYFTPF